MRADVDIGGLVRDGLLNLEDVFARARWEPAAEVTRLQVGGPWEAAVRLAVMQATSPHHHITTSPKPPLA